MSTRSTPEAPRAGWLWRALIRLLPKDFRDEYGKEMLQGVALERREAAVEGRTTRFLGGFRLALDLLRVAFAERVDSSFAVTTSRSDRTLQRSKGDSPMQTFALEVGQAVRSLLRRPVYALAVIGTLTLGIGTSTAIFTVVDSVLLRPLPFPEAHQLLRVQTRFDPESGFDFEAFPLSPPEVADYRDAAETVEDVAAYHFVGSTVTGVTETPERVSAALVSPNFFDVLRVPPASGRSFVVSDVDDGGEDVLILSWSWARERFGNEEVLGRRIVVDGRARTVVGLLPPEFRFLGSGKDLWMPLVVDPETRQNRSAHFLGGVARLAPDAGLEEAEAELDALMAAWKLEYPDIHSGHYVTISPLHAHVVGRARPGLISIFVASGLILLLACANVASLVLARGEERGREVAVRAALGAGKGRIVRLVLLESGCMAGAGALVGLALAYVGVPLLLALGGSSVPRASGVSVDWGVAAFAAAVAVLSTLLVASAPAAHALTRARTASPGGSQGVSATTRRVWFRRALLTGEVTLAFVLVLCAGLVVQSLERLTAVDLGVRRDGLLIAGLSLPATDYPDSASTVRFDERLLERVRALPGVESAATSTYVPLLSGNGQWDFDLEGREELVDSTVAFNASFGSPGPGLFETMAWPVVRGRGFTTADDADSELVAVVNEEFVERFLADVDPLGMRIRVEAEPERPWSTIVGVVGNDAGFSLDEEPRPLFLLPYTQAPRIFSGPLRFRSLVVRTGLEPASLLPDLRRTVASLDPSLPLIEPTTLHAAVSDAVARERFASVLLAVFAVIALALGASGIYGVLSHHVAQRRSELGLRSALGARPVELLSLVLRQGMVPVLVGLGFGVVLALGVGRWVRALLYGIEPTDGATFVAVGATVLAVALLACLLPGVRATRVDPNSALRVE